MDAFTFTSSLYIILGVLKFILLAGCLYFTLTFFQHFKENDQRLMKRSKIFAFLSLLLAFGLPAIFDMVISFQVIR